MCYDLFFYLLNPFSLAAKIELDGITVVFHSKSQCLQCCEGFSMQREHYNNSHQRHFLHFHWIFNFQPNFPQCHCHWKCHSPFNFYEYLTFRIFNHQSNKSCVNQCFFTFWSVLRINFISKINRQPQMCSWRSLCCYADWPSNHYIVYHYG